MARKTTEQPAQGELAIKAPILVTGHNEITYINVQIISDPVARRGLRALYDGLHEGHYRLEDGKHVDSAADAIRWLLREIGRNLPT